MSITGNLADAVNALLGAMEDSKIGDLTLSALINVDGDDPLDVTEKPVDGGFVMTDAATEGPKERSLEICLADPRFSVDALAAAALSGDVEQLTQTWREKKGLLFKMKSNRELVTVQTHDEVLPSMLVRNIVPHTDVNNNFDAYFATVHVKEIRVVEGSAAGGLMDQVQDAVGGL